MRKKFWIGLLIVTILAGAIYIMTNNIGLVDSLDFGAGAYYYTDIPEYERFLRDDLFVSKLPMWLGILLFFVWGYIMYFVWNLIERKWN